MARRTEDDLRELLNRPLDAAALKRLDAFVETLSSPPRSSRRSRWLAPIAAAAAVLGVAALAATATRISHDDRTSPRPVAVGTTSPAESPSVQASAGLIAPAALSVRQNNFSFTVQSGYTVGDGESFADSQMASVLRDGSDTGIGVVLYAKGKASITPTSAAPLAEVNGSPIQWATNMSRRVAQGSRCSPSAMPPTAG